MLDASGDWLTMVATMILMPGNRAMEPLPVGTHLLLSRFESS